MRVARTAAATLTHEFVVDEDPVAATGAVTVAVTDANGDSVSTGNATADGTTYTYLLPGQAALADLTVSWTGVISGTTVVETEQVAIVGRRLFTFVEGRASDSSLADEAKYTTDDLKQARDETEDELEEITGIAWAPRYRRVVLDGTGSPDLVLHTGDLDHILRGEDVTTIRSAAVAPRLDEGFEDLTVGQLAALAVLPDGTLRRADGLAWTWGSANVVVEFEYGGVRALPADLRRAMLTRFRSWLNTSRSGIPDRASSFTSADGGTYRLAMPGAYATGIPDVDAAYSRYSRRSQGNGKRRPASRTLSYYPQAGSLFHGRI